MGGFSLGHILVLAVIVGAIVIAAKRAGGAMSMLRILGVIYYLLAGVAILIALSDRGFGRDLTQMIGLAAGLSFAFFGAICLVADDMRALLRRIADAPSEGQTGTPSLLPPIAASAGVTSSQGG